MRNYLRETIRDEVREGVREGARHDSAAAAAGNQPSGDQVGDDRAGRPVQGESETQAQFRVVLRPLASSLPLEESYQRTVRPGACAAGRAAGTREAMGMRKRVIGVLQKAAAVREN